MARRSQDEPVEPERPGHYFDPRPTVPSRPARVRLDLPERTVDLATDRGVFSTDRVDPGTKVLLVEMGAAGEPDWPEGDLVDLGCGYGPIAVALALRHPGRRVWAVDPNERARALCATNAAAAGVAERITVVPPESVPADLVAAAVVSNPPIRIGKASLHTLLSEWTARLHPRGEMWLVVARNLGADSLARWMGAQGTCVERMASRRGYRVLRIRAAEQGRPGAAADPRDA